LISFIKHTTKTYNERTPRIFIDLYLKSKRQHFRVFVYKSNLYFFFIWKIIKWTKILGQENKQDWIHFVLLDETRKVKGKLKSKFNFEFKNYLNHYSKRSDHFLGALKFLHTVSVSSSDSLVIGFRCMFYKW
jgi:hypothetical protein